MFYLFDVKNILTQARNSPIITKFVNNKQATAKKKKKFRDVVFGYVSENVLTFLLDTFRAKRRHLLITTDIYIYDSLSYTHYSKHAHAIVLRKKFTRPT